MAYKLLNGRGFIANSNKLPNFHAICRPNWYNRLQVHKLSGAADQERQKPNWITFGHARHGLFFQKKAVCDNPFTSDIPLQRFLKRHIPSEIFDGITADLEHFGSRMVTEVNNLGWECEKNPPRLMPQDAWGEPNNELWTCDAWKKQHNISAEEGIVAIGYERKQQEWSRLYQYSKLYLYAPGSGFYSCPLAMTDGAAKTIEAVGIKNNIFQEAYAKLITRDPQKFWTSGQWMTERKGGSDVANGTETVAILDEGSQYQLYGYKWFSSASDSDMALTLARIADEDGHVIEGTKGLTLFYLETKPQGQLNNFQMVKLKNKLGTRQLPTAELLLDGTIAHKMSEEGQGVSAISNMLTITRIYNAISSVSAMRRILQLARDYSQRRVAFGLEIGKFPLHMQTLARMEVEVRGSMLLVLKIAIWLGKIECGVATDEDTLLLRLLTPVAKLYTAKQAISVISEGLEAFGGQGYIEDTGIPLALRDAQVFSIWEGTTNILSLDVLRCIAKTDGEVLKAFVSSAKACVSSGKSVPSLHASCSKVEKALEDIGNFVQNHPDLLVVAARDLSYSIARTYIGALLLENASCDGCTKEDISAARRWCELQDLCPFVPQHHLLSYEPEATNQDSSLVTEGYRKL